MAGPLTIQRLPWGLSDALAMRGTGDLPHELAQSLVASIDASYLYLGDQRATASSGTATTSPGTIGFFVCGAACTVPANEIWVLLNYTGQTPALAAGTTMEYMLGYKRSATNGVQMFQGTSAVVTAGNAYLMGYQFDPWSLILYPSDQVGLAVKSVTLGTAPTPTLTLDFYRLRF